MLFALQRRGYGRKWGTVEALKWNGSESGQLRNFTD